jgi:sulfopyruvate decarboxylase alpha subunit
MSNSKSDPNQDWPLVLFEELRRAKISIACHVPDAGHARLIGYCEAEPSVACIGLANEQEGVALCAGAWLGGARSALLMQSSGVGNCVNSLGMIKECRFPLLALITMRGEWGEFNPWQVPVAQATPALLELMGVIVHRADTPDAVAPTVAAAARLAFDSEVAVAVLLSQRLIGSKKFID